MLAKIINSEDLYGNTTQIDIAEAIPVGDRVYVLDRLHGISQFLNYFNGTFIRNPKFKMIPVTESTKVNSFPIYLLEFFNKGEYNDYYIIDANIFHYY